eukprot:jgi/Galph1/4393/GphlegSOOS_G3111.1
MTILCVSILNKTGKVLLSRQFVEISRIQLEGLLSAFSRLVGTGKQHTYVETESVRYVYQPLESLYVVLLTSKSSNVVEDLETLRLICKLIPEYLPIYATLEESSILEAAFELITAFDEVVDWGGLRENVDVQQVSVLTEMFSHEEKLANMIKESKMLEAKEVAKRRAETLAQEKSEREKLNKLGNDFRFQSLSHSGISAESYRASMERPDRGFAFTGMTNYGYEDSSVKSDVNEANTVVSAGIGGKGLSLGGKKRPDAMLEALKKEGDLLESSTRKSKLTSTVGMKKTANTDASNKRGTAVESIHLSAQEEIVLEMNRDGVIHNFEIKGNLMLQVSDPSKACVRFHMQMGNMNAFQVRTHPNIDKSLWTSNQILGLKDASRPFPAGNPLSILRWRLVSSEESLIPLSINCWPAQSSTDTVVIIEYELMSIKELQNILISVPIPKNAGTPKLRGADGEFSFNSRQNVVEWRVPLVGQDSPQGSLEFVTESVSAESFFPVSVSFFSDQIYGDIGIESVIGSMDEQEQKFSFEKSLSVERFLIVND